MDGLASSSTLEDDVAISFMVLEQIMLHIEGFVVVTCIDKEIFLRLRDVYPTIEDVRLDLVADPEAPNGNVLGRTTETLLTEFNFPRSFVESFVETQNTLEAIDLRRGFKQGIEGEYIKKLKEILFAIVLVENSNISNEAKAEAKRTIHDQYFKS
eukprot:TRINITY_DN1229_c0_g1_i3.p1 TRINITY_DN1229_c0_g1~~TRINITY_DN1229_c0_g1_i3.p1  ORF type:complete len:155 (-),score=35.21 TRINITY_DN1229_c0_g1_i3:48-512(-)